jgi:hypothetical protein
MTKMRQMALLILIIIAVCGFAEARQLDPVEDVHSYMVRFTQISEGILPDSVTTTVFDDTLYLEMLWTQPDSTLDFDKQANPFIFSRDFINTEYVSILNRADLYQDGVVVGSAVTDDLTVGHWQVQVATSIQAANGDLIWSKYSDAIGWILVDPDEPFDRPVRLILQVIRP